MPIYAYRCQACGFAKDVLQKLSDAQLTECPSCSQSTFKKQLTAAGFQLKGTGWYATDFRGASPAAAPAAGSEPAAAQTGSATAAKPDAAAPAPAPASSPAVAQATPGASKLAAT